MNFSNDTPDSSFMNGFFLESTKIMANMSAPPPSTPTETNTFYHAASYSRYARHQRKIGFRVLAEHYHLIADLPFPAKVLDVGCGTGEMTRLLTYFGNVREVLGMDLSAEHLAIAETFNADDRINYQIGDIQDPYYIPAKQRDNYFDLCSCMAALHWITDPVKGLETIKRSLKPGGFLVAWTLACYPRRYRVLLQALNESDRWAQHAHVVEEAFRKTFNPGWWKSVQPETYMGQMLEQLGMEVLNVTLEDDKMIYNSDEIAGEISMMKSICGSSVPEKEYPEFIEFCTMAYRNHFDKIGKEYYMSDRKILVIVARKM